MSTPTSFKRFLVFAIALFIAKASLAQVVFLEDFQGGIPSSWSMANVDGLTSIVYTIQTTEAWIAEASASFGDPNDSVAVSTSWYNPAGTADDWLMSPQIVLPEYSTLSWDEKAQDEVYRDGYELYITTAIAGGAPTVSDFTGSNGAMIYSIAEGSATWVNRSLNLFSLGYGDQPVWFAWRNNSYDKFLLLIDDIAITDVGGTDVSASAVLPEFTFIPQDQYSLIEIVGRMHNVATATVTNTNMRLNVYNSAAVNIYSETINALPPLTFGDSVDFVFTGFTPPSSGQYTFEFIANILEVDDDLSNDTARFELKIGNTIARDLSDLVGDSYDPWGGVSGEVGTSFYLAADADLTSVDVLIRNLEGSMTGQPLSCKVYEMTSGTVGALLGVSDVVTVDASVDTRWNLPISGGAISLSASDTFFVSIVQPSSPLTIGLSSGVFTPGANQYRYGAQPWQILENRAIPNTSLSEDYFQRALLIRANFGPGSCFPRDTVYITESVCDAYTSPIGTVYSATGVYQESLLDVVGCDSIAYVLDLTFLESTRTVTNSNDSGPGSLRQALSANCDGDTILFDASTNGNPIVLTSGDISFSESLVIIGNGPSNTIIDGNAFSRIFEITGADSTILRNMTIRNGNASGSGAAGSGGGIFASGGSKIILDNMVISGNTANTFGGGANLGASEIQVLNSTISGNTSSSNAGGMWLSGISGSANIQISGSTISYNQATFNGGGMFISNGSVSSATVATINIQKSTLVGNTAGSSGGVIFGYCTSSNHTATQTCSISNSTLANNSATSNGGGIYMNTLASAGTTSNLNLQSSIVALNGSNNIFHSHSPTITSLGYNIFDDASISGSSATDILGATELQLNLGTLQDNGGTAYTMLPGCGSIAINAGNPSDASDAQNASLSDGRRDVGAAENQLQTTSNFSVTEAVSYTVPSGNQTITDFGTQVVMDTIPNVAGCDSVMTISVTIGTCGVPSFPTVTNIIDTAAVLSWTGGVLGADRYQMRWRAVGESDWEARNTFGEVGYRHAKVFEPDTEYEWIIRTRCGAGDGDSSEWVSGPNFTTLAGCGPVQDVTISNVTQTQVDATWPNHDGATEYLLRFKPTSALVWRSKRVDGFTTSTTLRNLLPATEYEYRLRVYCETGLSRRGELVNFTTASAPGARLAASEEEQQSTEFILYPNPTQGDITIEFGSEVENASIEVMNALGQTVYSKGVTGSDRIQLTTDLQSGAYLISVTIGAERMMTKLLVE